MSDDVIEYDPVDGLINTIVVEALKRGWTVADIRGATAEFTEREDGTADLVIARGRS